VIYLDYNATTPVDPRVLEAMLPFFRESFGNAASRHHALGCDAAKAVEKAREQVAALIGADPREIYWTSGATEADNLAIQGVAASRAYATRGNHLVTVATEHRAVLDPCEHLQSKGFTVTYLGVDREGLLDLNRLEEAITPQTILVSIMHANNETGVLHPLREIGELCKAKKVLFHTDATQSFGKEPIDVEADGIDLLSASAHKICGPKGVGLLHVRRRNPRVRCEPLLHGGGHEKGLRSGTLNVPAIVGMGEAAEIARKEGPAEQPRIRALRDRFESSVRTQLGRVEVNGHPDKRLGNTSNLSFPGLDGEALMKAMPDVAASSSSACTSALLQPSYVLGALGCDDDRIRGSIRFSLGRFTTAREIEAAVERVVIAAGSFRKTVRRRLETR
jgi:cysteine desulfurase